MNPLKKEVNDFLKKIALYESLHYQTKVHLSKRIQEIKKILELKPRYEPYIGTSLTIGDITGETDNGWKYNYPTDFQTEIEGEQMVESIEKLISQNGMTYLANCYEILESFLFNIIGEFLNNYTSYNKLLKDKNENLKDKKEFLRKYYRSKNNKDLLKLLRKISSEFENSEQNNNTGMNLNDWFYVITNIRHSIVHSLHIIDVKKLNFNKHQKEILNHNFSSEKFEDFQKLNMTYKESKKQINLIAEFGFMIFKSLSITENENWKILHNMNK